MMATRKVLGCLAAATLSGRAEEEGETREEEESWEAREAAWVGGVAAAGSEIPTPGLPSEVGEDLG